MRTNFFVEGQKATHIEKKRHLEFVALFSGVKYELKDHQNGKLIIVKDTPHKLKNISQKFEKFINDICAGRKLECGFDERVLAMVFQAKKLYVPISAKLEGFEQKYESTLDFSTSGVNIDVADIDQIAEKISSKMTLRIKKDLDITKQVADVLVCPIQENMERTTVVRKSFAHVCPAAEEALKTQYDANKSDKMFTIENVSNNLGKIGSAGVKAIIYVMLKRNNGTNITQSAGHLQKQIEDVLHRAASLKAKSIAFPQMGSNRAFKFSEDSSTKAFLGAVRNFSKQNGSVTDVTLLIQNILFRKYYESLPSHFPDVDFEREKFKREILLDGPASLDIQAAQTEMKSILTQLCCRSEVVTHDDIAYFDAHTEHAIFDLAKKSAVIVDKQTSNKPGYKLTGPDEGRREVRTLIEKSIRSIQENHSLQIKDIKAKRGSLEYISAAYKIIENKDRLSTQDSSSVDAFEISDVDEATTKAVSEMIETLWLKSQGKIGKGNDARNLKGYSNINIKKVERLKNASLLDNYEFQRKTMLKARLDQKSAASNIANLKSPVDQNGMVSDGPVKSTEEVDEMLKSELLSEEINEQFLFHGCKPKFKQIIMRQGFDHRVANPNGMFGAGIYFAEDPVKADQYTGE